MFSLSSSSSSSLHLLPPIALPKLLFAAAAAAADLDTAGFCTIYFALSLTRNGNPVFKNPHQHGLTPIDRPRPVSCSLDFNPQTFVTRTVYNYVFLHQKRLSYLRILTFQGREQARGCLPPLLSSKHTFSYL